MGKGIAYQFKEAFPKNYDLYRGACKKGEFKIGSILIVNEKKKLIVNFPTKDTWKKKSHYDFIASGLDKLKEEIINRGISSIAIPPLGCGNGGLKWEIVESMIIKTLGDLDSVDIILFSPPIKNTLDLQIDSINNRHLLVHHVFTRLANKYRYTLNAVFYASTFLSKDSCFNFTIKHGRPYSEELNEITNSLKSIKDKYNDEFETFIANHANTNLTREIENERKKYLPSINYCIDLFNKIDSKDDYTLTCKILREISENPLISYDAASKEGFLLEKLIHEGLISKNIFNELEVLNLSK
ncbi:Macro domain-containing protein [Rouxiella silvae]